MILRVKSYKITFNCLKITNCVTNKIKGATIKSSKGQERKKGGKNKCFANFAVNKSVTMQSFVPTVGSHWLYHR